MALSDYELRVLEQMEQELTASRSRFGPRGSRHDRRPSTVLWVIVGLLAGLAWIGVGVLVAGAIGAIVSGVLVLVLAGCAVAFARRRSKRSAA